MTIVLTDTVGVLKELKKAGKQISALSGSTYAKGDLFEARVAKLFPEPEFSILHATTRRDDLEGRMIESAKNPDLHIKHIKSNHKFWVECKYRRKLYQDKVQWCEQYQLDRYRKFQNEVWRDREKVYVVIGLGGVSSNPKSIYCVPLYDIGDEDTGLNLKALQPYWHPRNQPYSYTSGRLR